jgi:hypothetical protein
MLLYWVDFIFNLVAYYASDLIRSAQTKQAKIQWLQDPNQSTVDNMNNVRCEAVYISETKRGDL